MEYGFLVNENEIFMANPPLLINNQLISNPTHEQYLLAGYHPVFLEEYPTEIPDGKYPKETWTQENGGAIYQHWVMEDFYPLDELVNLKNELASYDYIGIKIAMGVATHEEYAEQIAYTETLRQRIREIIDND